jgi:hypothetical protein
MKLLKTLLRENGFTEPNQYYELILTQWFKGNHNNASKLFQELKRDEKEYFLTRYLNPEAFKRTINFFIKELLIN